MYYLFVLYIKQNITEHLNAHFLCHKFCNISLRFFILTIILPLTDSKNLSHLTNHNILHYDSKLLVNLYIKSRKHCSAIHVY